MEIRKYQSSDLKVICELFYETINTINRYDYNNDQSKYGQIGVIFCWLKMTFLTLCILL